MPYVYVDREDYNLIPRLTEIAGALDCEEKAYHHPVHSGKREWTEMSTYVALKGTLLHHKIDNFCRESIDLPPLPLDLQMGDKQMYEEIMNDPDALDWMIEQNNHGWENFKKFWYDFNPEVIFSEQTMVYIHRDAKGNIVHKKSAKGTVDLFCEIDPDQMDDKIHKKFPISEKMTVMLDWKSGRSKQPVHHAQLEGYHWMTDVTGLWNDWVDKNIVKYPFAHITNATGRTYPTALCVLLGGKKSYNAIAYDLTEGLFQQARDIFLNPRPIALSRTRWANNIYREGYGCVFCTYRDTSCSIFKMIENTVDLEVKK